jgi:hypothetical protein
MIFFQKMNANLQKNYEIKIVLTHNFKLLIIRYLFLLRNIK